MDNNFFVLTEAELQARLESHIRKALPLLAVDIKIERHLHLQLGHKTFIIDGFKPERSDIYGRYDILLMLDDKPLIIFELKAPEVTIEEGENAQALSYARLHVPIVPLVLVTNGKDFQILNTYDGKKLDESDISRDRLKSILSVASTLAASRSEDAIHILLGTSKYIWTELFSTWTEETLVKLTGNIHNFKYPICHEFTIPREIVKKLVDNLVEGTSIQIIHGPPLSGITNVLVQLAREKNIGPVLFINGKTCPDVFQYIANRLSRELLTGVTKDNLRNWLNTRHGLQELTLVIDGLPKIDVEELIENANAGLFRLVIGMDTEMYKRCSTVEGRTQLSSIGQQQTVLEILPLTNDEFDGAQRVFYNSFQATFFNGSQYIVDLRFPRKLRVIASLLPKKDFIEGEPETHIKIPPIFDPLMLEKCNEAFGSLPALKIDLQMLTAVFLADLESHFEDTDWIIMIWGRPSVDPITLEQKLGSERIARLLEQGFLSWISTKDFGPRLLICVDELLAYNVAEEWANKLEKNIDETIIISELKHLLHLSSLIPSGEIALALAIFKAAQKNDNLLSITIPFLRSQKPIVSKIKQGDHVAVLIKGKKITLYFSEDVKEEALGNVQPWMVLSHLSSLPMSIEGDEKTMNFYIFAELGSSRHFLYRPSSKEDAPVQSLHFHEIKGIGPIPCLAGTGIVEPLLQAMLNYVNVLPEEFIKLAEYALEKKEVYLTWRLLSVAIVSKTTVDMDVQKAVEEVERMLGTWWGDALDEAMKIHKSEEQ
jgi:hypothetical protein